MSKLKLSLDNEYPGTYYYRVIRGDKTISTYVKMWNMHKDEDGNKFADIRYFMPYPIRVQEHLRANLKESLAEVDTQIILDDVEKAKLVLLGL